MVGHLFFTKGIYLAIIVDKEQKRRDIALSCKDLVVEKGINNLSVAALAKAAGVGKGTMYEYFKNKDEIVFEIVNILMQKHTQRLQQDIEIHTSTKEKVKLLSQFFYSEEEEDLREIYKEFISISLTDPSDEMLHYQTEQMSNYYEWFKEIIQNGIDSGELKPEAYELSMGLFVAAKGMFVVSNTTFAIEDIEKELNLFIDTIFKLMEVKS